MAQNSKGTYKVTNTKSKTKKASNTSGNSTRNNPRNGKNSSVSPKSAPVKNNQKSGVGIYHFVPVLLILGAVLLTISFFVKDFGVVGNFIRDKVFFGIFSVGTYVIPPFMAVLAVIMFRARNTGGERAKLICTAVMVVIITALFHIFFADDTLIRELNPITHYVNGIARQGGGFIGGFFGALFVICFSEIGASVIFIAALLILFMVVLGKTPRQLFEDIADAVRERREISAVRREERFERAQSQQYENENYDTYEYFDDEDIPDFQPPVKEARGVNTRKRKTEFDPNITDEDFPVESAEKEETQLEIPSEDQLPDFDAEDSFEAVEPVIEAADESARDTRDAEEDMTVFDNPDDEEVLRRLSETYLGEDVLPKRLKVKTDDLSPTLQKGDVIDIPEEKKETKPAEAEYVFPSIELLTKDTESHSVDSTRELTARETKLIKTLEQFNVHTESAGLPSKGPSVTRYELRPSPGTKVRSIVNLVDDIALSLATSGVRIEAPIPGKSAVGIEVPNENREIVRLRTLIETPAFRNAKSRVNVALGEDVAGAPVFFDISKMPHLLIAGATGMGKSVCINCIIVSLLYKAKPDEVKLILIDPKKVEFNMYSSLPHLLVPVVSDPKKAAGALSWAVNEMERRYSLIEASGTRNIFGYNETCDKDPKKERLSQIIIVIDELADLMMTAPDSVEDSICRLAQKARAAGMHLIIGTQRPSVDVITGTIKNNIPSRIACTVASYIDSKTIIDTAGAEKLIGQGDMLFAPVGLMKPMRVQGAFVSDSEVESIVEYIKEKNQAEGGYSDDVMAQIESEASRCISSKKKSAGEDALGEVSGDGEDPMFWKAAELAVESGKISTSLIQRKCSLGFGRAAKLIDRMEELGFVSAPDGQKPRQVLITKDQLYEMKMGGVADTDEEEEI